MIKRALNQAGEIARRFYPQLAYLYYREIFNHGKNHKQAMKAVMSHLGARILAVLRENRPYELRDIHSQPISIKDALWLIQSEYQVPILTRQARRRRNSNEGRSISRRTHEAAQAPQSGQFIPPPVTSLPRRALTINSRLMS